MESGGSMNVRELISILKKIDPETIVCINSGGECEAVNIDEVKLETFDGWKEKVVLR